MYFVANKPDEQRSKKMKTFEECWEKAVAEMVDDTPKSVSKVHSFVNKDGKTIKVRLLQLEGGTFISVYAMRKALGVSVIAQNVIQKGISMQKIYSDDRHGRYILDAENAVKFLARYGENEPGFKDFFRDNIFGQLSDFGG